MGKVINWELCKKFKFDHTNERSDQENVTKFLWDFEIQTDHLILTRTPDLEIVYKKRVPAE